MELFHKKLSLNETFCFLDICIQFANFAYSQTVHFFIIFSAYFLAAYFLIHFSATSQAVYFLIHFSLFRYFPSRLFPDSLFIFHFSAYFFKIIKAVLKERTLTEDWKLRPDSIENHRRRNTRLLPDCLLLHICIPCCHFQQSIIVPWE